MAAMMLILKNVNNAHAFIKFYVIAAISWSSPLISQLFSSRILKVVPFLTAWLFCVDFISYCTLYMAPKPAIG